MFIPVKIFLISAAVFTLCDSFAVVPDKFQKCSLKEPSCLTNLMTEVVNFASIAGIPEVNIPRLDPYAVKDITVSFLDLEQLTVHEGIFTGIKSCVIKNMNIDTQRKIGTFDVYCEKLVVDGHYQIEMLPALKLMLNEINIHADGNGRLVLENLVLHLVWPFEAKELEDGKLHFMIKPDECTFTYELNGKFVFNGDNIYVGSVDISAVVSAIVNENWKFVARAAGRGVAERISIVYTKYIDRFLRGTAAQEIFTDDLTFLVA